MKKRFWQAFKEDEAGVGVVEVVLILVVLVSLVLIFKTQITALVEGIFSDINAGVESVVS